MTHKKTDGMVEITQNAEKIWHQSALVTLAKAKKQERLKELSGNYRWIRIDSNTEVYRKIK